MFQSVQFMIRFCTIHHKMFQSVQFMIRCFSEFNWFDCRQKYVQYAECAAFKNTKQINTTTANGVVNRFWTFRKRIKIVFDNDRFHKNDLRPFFIQLFFNDRFWKKILLTILLTIVYEELSLTIVNETTNVIKTVVFGKKIHATLLNVVLHEV